jgi:hypothetical protein
MADAEISADTDTKISAETDTETDNFWSLCLIKYYFWKKTFLLLFYSLENSQNWTHFLPL